MPRRDEANGKERFCKYNGIRVGENTGMRNEATLAENRSVASCEWWAVSLFFLVFFLARRRRTMLGLSPKSKPLNEGLYPRLCIRRTSGFDLELSRACARPGEF